MKGAINHFPMPAHKKILADIKDKPYFVKDNFVIKIIKSPWEDVFVNCLKQAKRQVYLASPFIKKQTAELIIKNCGHNLDIRYLNAFKLNNFFQGASDLEALRIFDACKIKQKNVPRLHAKFFVFDDMAIVTSGNLTPGGLKNNVEYGVMLAGKVSQEVERDYLNIFNDKEHPAITLDIIEEAQKILSSVPKEKRPKINVNDKKLFAEVASDENLSDRFSGGIESIVANLASWKRDVFDCLLLIKDDVFSIDEVYRFSEQLKKLHPDNKNIEPKIRQQLQYLRDLGLIEFVGDGVYRKLWV
ncbi:MAG: phospholipase D-like domain-containing protein [Candidatus Paceibacterota bacterium]|jgi:phosphatidylserine/phosphatidylglycerophosphate/cardiolipin synthase-like enzyme